MTAVHYDIVMLVIASRGEGYDNMIHYYWKPFIQYVKNNNLSIKIYLIFGNNYNIDDLNLHDDALVLNTKDSIIPGILIKTLMAFKYIENNYTYKHILRTNLSSFYLIDNLLKTSRILPQNDVYAGVNGIHKQKQINFISGASFWLSQDNVRFIIFNENNLLHSVHDDVSIGEIMKSKTFTKLSRYIMEHDIEVNEIQNKLNSIIIDGHTFIRLKMVNDTKRQKDVYYMKKFTEILYLI